MHLLRDHATEDIEIMKAIAQSETTHLLYKLSFYCATQGFAACASYIVKASLHIGSVRYRVDGKFSFSFKNGLTKRTRTTALSNTLFHVKH